MYLPLLRSTTSRSTNARLYKLNQFCYVYNEERLFVVAIHLLTGGEEGNFMIDLTKKVLGTQQIKCVLELAQRAQHTLY